MIFRKRKSAEASDIQYKEGFDNPISPIESDLLARQTVTNQVYSYLTNLNPEWSVRVGIIAPWGEGKTTVCRWVATRALKDGHIPVWWRNPWAAKTDAELWLGFYTALTTALSDHGIEFEGSIKHFLATWTKGDWAEKASTFHAFAQAGLGLIQNLTQMTSKDITNLRAALNGKRLIVIIDDLDRVDAALIPRLFMSLRDVMDIEGFSFLLPFDGQMISDALGQHNRVPGYGEKFLEKILDFRVYLVPATQEKVAAFIRHELQQNCPFIKTDVSGSLDKNFPTNPRKLKSLVRGLRIFQTEGERYRAEEVDWQAIIFAQMIKMESEPFFRLFVENTFGKNEDRSSVDKSDPRPWMLAAMEKDKEKAKETEIHRLNCLLNEAQVKTEETKKRLIDLCEGWREAQGYWNYYKIVYALRILDMPETLTWAEFDDFWNLWNETKTFSKLIPWISAHAEKMEKTSPEIIREIIIAMSQQYDLHLEKASSVTLRSEHQVCINDAQEILDLLILFLNDSIILVSQESFLTAEVFEKYFGFFCKWAHFTGNKADQKLRETEKIIIDKWIRKINDIGLSSDYTLHLKKDWGLSHTKQKQEIEDLKNQVLATLTPVEDDMVQQILEREGGVRDLFPYDAGPGVKDRLVNIKSNLWNSNNDSPALRILATADKNPVVQVNALDLLHLLHDTSSTGTWELGADQVKEFYLHPELIAAIWKAAIATPLQFRCLSSARDLRKHLISMDIEEDVLPMPNWLLAGMKNNETNETEQTSNQDMIA